MTEFATVRNDPDEAIKWFRAAVDAWERIDEWLWAELRIGMLIGAWAGVGHSQRRLRALDDVRRVLRRVASLEDRDTWQAYIALAFWDDLVLFREHAAVVTRTDGLDRLLSAARDRDGMAVGILPDLIYDVLEKNARLAAGSFLGNSLSSCQALAHRRLFKNETVASALMFIETKLRALVAP
jgi:hypothetical protein